MATSTILLTLALQGPTTAEEWLRRAERTLGEAETLRVRLRRTFMYCEGPDIAEGDSTASLSLRGAGGVRLDFDDGRCRIGWRSNGTTLAGVRGTLDAGEERDRAGDRRALPGRLRGYVVDSLVRAGIDPSWCVWPVMGYEGEGDLPDPFGIEEAGVEEGPEIGGRSTVCVRYVLALMWGVRYRMALYLDAERAVPVRREAEPYDPVTQHGLLAFTEEYESVELGADCPEEEFAIPGDWPTDGLRPPRGQDD